jgi:MscS family membrane protein
MDIFATIEKFLTSMGLQSWVVQLFVIVFLTLLVAYIQRRIVLRIQSRLDKTKTQWDDAFIEALRRPLTVLIWIVGIAFAIQVVQSQTEAKIFEAVGPIRDVGVIAVIAWFLVRFIKRAEANVISRREERGEEVDRTTVDAMAKLLRLSVLITATLVALQTLGFSVSGVLAFGGIGGIAVGFAAKDLLANFFGGLMIYLDRPFTVGDWIRSPDRDIEGTVEQIGWRLTRIRTFDSRPLYIPNATFTSIAVENPSRMQNRRIYETVGVRYDDASTVGAIVEDVTRMLRSHPDIDGDKTLMVNFNKMAASSLDFFIYCFTKTTGWSEYHRIKQDVLLKILDIVAEHGAEVAFPTSTVHLADGK